MRQPISPPSAIDRLTRVLGLSSFERDLVLLCAGVEMDAELARLAALAQGTLAQGTHQRRYATFALALAVLAEAHWDALTPASPLRRWRILEVDDSAALVEGRLKIDERILHYLAGVNYLDARLRPLLTLKRPSPVIAPAHQRLCDSLLAAISDADSAADAQQCLVLLSGDDAQGQGAITAYVANSLGLQLYRLNVENLPASAAEIEALAVLWQREAALLGAALLVECLDRDAPKHLASFLEQLDTLVFVSAREPLVLARRAVCAVVNKPDAVDQRILWQQALGPAAGRINGALEGVASQFRLSASTIATTGGALRATLMTSERPDALLWRACREASGSRLGEHAERIEAQADWDSLILPTPQKTTLRLIAAHVRHRLTVYHEWGFGARGARGLGITALFAGESGTGKTMAAEVLANELQLDLYRVDLSAVVSKYIGETEKNLRRVFDAAEESGAILLFDEADALFGKRSEVKDSHDRYANIEVSYLLQRMESYRGLAILTTNMKAALDTAFRRRLRFVVQFPFPDIGEREAIWRSIFPPATPLTNVDFAKLAKLHVAGGNIRNIALNAAFLAAQAHRPVQMAHLLEAAHAEGAKRERPLADAETRGWV